MRHPLSTSGTVTSGERDASQPQVRDRAERSLPNATNRVNSGEAEQRTEADTADRERLRALLLRRTTRQPSDVDEGPAPLSPGQRRLWFLDRLLPDSALYNAPLGFRVRGSLDVDALRAALETVVARQEALRTTFREVDGRPMQVVHDHVDVPVRYADLTGLPAGHVAGEAQRLAVASGREPFDLSTGPLLRLLVLRLAPDDHVVVLTVHHAVVDGWSLTVLFGELGAAHDAAVAGRAAHLPPLRTRYRDHARAQEAALAGERTSALAGHWREVLAGAPDEVTFPADRARRAEPTYGGALCRFTVSPATTAALRALAREQDATLFMVMLAAFAVLLGRYARTEDVVVGSPVAGRDRPEVANLVGFFVNSVVLRTDLSGAPSVAELVRRVRERALDAYAHQDLPFERLVDELRPERRLSAQPVFQTSFQVFESAGPVKPELAGAVTEEFPVDNGTAKFDTSWLLVPAGDGLAGTVEFATDSYDEATVAALTRAYVRLLDQFAAAAHRPVADLDPLPPADRDRILGPWNDTAGRWAPAGAPFAHLAVRARAAAVPDALAVREADGTELTYAELAGAVGGLAGRLQAAGVGRGDLVGVCLPRSADLVVAFLAVLEAGAAYVPVDPAQPARRVRQLLADAAPRVVIATAPLTGLDVPVVAPGGPPGDAPGVPLTADDTAYVIYTSGSTGHPKGVAVTHGGLANYLRWCAERYLAAPGGSALLTSCAYDLVVPALYAPLLAGRPVHVLPAGLDLARLGHTLAAGAPYSFLKLTPGHLELLVDQLGAERARKLTGLLVVGGEALTTDTAAPWLAPGGPEVLNEYGPTEATVANCTYLATTGDGGTSVPVGTPIPNTTQYVLDERGRPVPPGAAGELHIGGAGVASGYLRRPARTAAAFVPDPFGRPGGRLYRTGDLVRLRHDGVVAYLGRLDDQVKINGHRVEPGEVAARLREHPAVRDTVVTVRHDRGTASLAAYMVPERVGTEPDGAATAQLQRTWREVFDTSYAGAGGASDAASDFAGWTSSFTGEPVPEPAMREWVAASVDRVRALTPRRVLEIGCGTGLLLRALAPEVERYVGLDFSAEALAHLHDRMTAAGERTDHVTLRQLAADELDRVDERFDVIVVNSVAQYFPSGDYLRAVLTAAVARTVDGGAVFVGDVRDLGVAGVEATAIELFRAAGDVPASELLGRVRARLARESELLVDPRFFDGLVARIPRLRSAAAAPRRGRLDSEMTRFRYDVVLRVGHDVPRADVTWSDWTRDGWSLARLAGALADGTRTLAIAGVPNARLAGAAATLAMLESGTETDPHGVDPEDIHDLAAEHGAAVTLWCAPGTGGRFHVLLGDTDPVPPPTTQPAVLTSDPLRATESRRYAELLRPYLADRLPPALVPAAFVVLDRIPLTANGKLDRAALPAPAGAALDHRSAVVAGTPVERDLADIWCEVLGIGAVGVHDNFFELGGDSIQGIRVVSRAVAAGHPITPKMIFQYPTVAELARAVGSGRAGDAEQGAVAGPVGRTPIADWFLDHGDPVADLVVQHVTVPLPAGADPAAVAAAVAHLLTHHDALRLRLGPDGFEILPEATVPVTRTEAQPDSPQWTEAMARACAGIDVTTGPMLAAVHGDGALLLAVHHLAVDAVSWPVLVEDLARAYRGDGAPPAKTVSVRQWAAHLAEAARDGTFAAELPHWHAIAAADAVRLPGAAGTYGGAAVHESTLPARLTTDLLEKVPRAYRTRITEVLLATLARVLRRWAGGDVLVDAEGHGRDSTDLDLTRTVGWFTTLYPVLVPVDDPDDVRAALLATKEHLRASESRGLAHGVLTRLAGAGEPAVAPRVRFNYLGRLGSATAGEPFTVTVPGTFVSPSRPRRHLLEIDAMVVDGELLVRWTHNPSAQPTTEVATLARRFGAELARTIAHCLDPANHGRTPSDFPLAGLDQATVDRYLGDREIEDVYPLTPTQEGMVFESVAAGEPGMYLEQVSWRMRDLDEARFARAFEQTADRHEVLRTRLVTTGRRTLQVVRRRAAIPVTVVDLSTAADREHALAELLAADRERGVDLSGGGPLLRLTLVRLGDEHHVLVTNHHVILDGWSSALVFTEVLRRYAGTWTDPGRPPAYRGHVAAMLTQSANPAPADVAYWRAELGDARPRTLDLGPPTDATGMGVVDVPLPAGLSGRLTALAGRLRVTAGTMVLGAWALVLSRYLASTDVVCGVTVSGRAGLPDPEGMVGLFINTVPTRLRVPGAVTADRWLVDLHAEAGRRPETHALTDIRAWAGVDATAQLFDTVLVVENYPMDAGLRETLAGPDGAMVVTDRTNYPLTVAVELGASALVRLLFDRTRHPEAAVAVLADRLVRVLATMVERPRTPLRDIAIDSSVAVEDAGGDLEHTDVVRAVLAHARRAPEHPAVAGPDGTIDYATLVRRAAALGARLRAAGAGPDVPVAVVLPRSVGLVVAQLAVLWAGAAYLPLDPDQPAAHRRRVLARAGCTLGITTDGTPDGDASNDAFGASAGDAGVTWLTADAGEGGGREPVVPHPAATAYVLHTSGSTGVPKGVAVPRGVLSAHLAVVAAWLDLTSADRVLHLSPATFDIAIEQVLGTLVAGATVVLGGTRPWAPREFLAEATAAGVTVANIAAPYWHQVVEELELGVPVPAALPVRLLLLGADKVHGDAVARWSGLVGDRVVLTHGYGVTEAVITSTLGRIDPAGTGARAGVGATLPLRSLRVVDVHGGTAPVGVPGEVLLAGPALARGYLGAPAATAAAFVPDPAGGPGARAYRTGDLGRLRADGTVEVLGRMDDQVKVRGLRVEPGQVEHALRDHPEVTDAAVVVADDRLVAFVTGPADPDTARAHAAETLPGTLVPDMVLAIEALPLTAHGKLDRPALHRLAAAAGADRDDSEPTGVIENLVADVWREVLGLDRVARGADFYRLGGHSLRAMSVAVRLREALGVEVPVRLVLRHPKLTDFATALSTLLAEEIGVADLEAALSGL